MVVWLPTNSVKIIDLQNFFQCSIYQSAMTWYALIIIYHLFHKWFMMIRPVYGHRHVHSRFRATQYCIKQEHFARVLIFGTLCSLTMQPVQCGGLLGGGFDLQFGNQCSAVLYGEGIGPPKDKKVKLNPPWLNSNPQKWQHFTFNLPIPQISILTPPKKKLCRPHCTKKSTQNIFIIHKTQTYKTDHYI